MNLSDSPRHRLRCLSRRRPPREPVFDVHVHLRDVEASLKSYEADVAASKTKLAGFGAMWFGGPAPGRARRAGENPREQ